MSDFKKEWMVKAEIDYFAPFINLWLACNSWYTSHYSERDVQNDRAFIDQIKTDTSKRNHLYVNFKKLLDDNSIIGNNFRHHIESLNKFLYRAEITPGKLKYCLLDYVLVDYNDKDNTTAYQSIFEKVELKTDGNPKTGYEQCVKLDEKYLIADIPTVFAGMFELIYTVRNVLVHGKMDPTEDAHNVVKYCYLILWGLMN